MISKSNDDDFGVHFRPSQNEVFNNPSEYLAPPVRSINFTILENNQTIRFTWRPPTDDDVVDYYEVSLSDIDTKETWKNETTLTEWEIDAEPCANYQFLIFAVINGERNEENLRVVNMPISPPDMVEIESENSTSTLEPIPSTTLQVTWKPPKFARRCVKFYIVQFWRKHRRNGEENRQKLNVTETKVTIINLDACEVYKMEITPAIDDENMGTTLKREINAQGREPIKPNMPTRAGGTSTTFKFFIKREDISTVCQLYVAKFVCSYQGTINEIQQVSLSVCC